MQEPPGVAMTARNKADFPEVNKTVCHCSA